MESIDKKNVVTADVLIIGAGAAGIFAAVEAHKRGTDVLLLTKGLFCRDGASSWCTGESGSTNIQPPDTVETQAKCLIIGGRFLNDQETLLASLHAANDNYRALTDLYNWGFKYKRDPTKVGGFAQIPVPGVGLSRPFKPMREGPRQIGVHGAELRRVLANRVNVLKIRYIDDLFVTDLLIAKGRCVGAVGIDIKTGEFKVFNAKATILATGGLPSTYEKTAASWSLTGDGQAMAWRAGVEMTNMEFPDLFLPGPAAWPPILNQYNTWYGMQNGGGAMYNVVGQRFMAFHRVEYQGHMLEWQERGVRAITTRAIQKEVREGRGIHFPGQVTGGVYITYKHLPRQMIPTPEATRRNSPQTQRIFDMLGIDFSQDAVYISGGTEYSLAGCEGNTKCETSLKGLYAAGEVEGTKTGANRLENHAMHLCYGQGYISGENAAEKAKEMKTLPEVDWDQVEKLRERAYSPLKKENGTSPFELKKRLKTLFSTYYFFGRSKEGLETALSEIEKIQKEELPPYVKSKSMEFNMEWVAALETMNIVDLGGMIGRSALMRTESRGGHERVEFPNADPAWEKRIITWQENGVPKFRTVPIKFILLSPPKNFYEVPPELIGPPGGYKVPGC